MQKNLQDSKKSSTFAPAFEKSLLLNGVMVALQILVLSVWVRVLVEQQRKVSSWGLFLLQRDSHPGSYLATLERLISKLIFRVLVEQQKI